MKKILLSLFLLVCSTLTANSHAIRAAIDIGMGGPKLQVAEVDLTTNKIVRELCTQRYFVNFYESISQNENKQISFDTMIQGLDAFKEAVALAHSFNANDIVSIATASFRSASNGLEFANIIQEETGIKVHIIDQNLEGTLSFQAALAKVNTEPNNLIVWDVGGGSIQLITQTISGDCLVNCGEEGVGAFNDYIINHIQSKDVERCKTPNPMSSKDILQATTYAENLSHKVHKVFKDKILQSNSKVIGVGNVFGYGIASMVGKDVFSLDDIKKVACNLAGKTDEDLGGGAFAFCEGSNVLFVCGFMLGLGIDEIQVLPINNANGAIVYKPFWD